MKSLRPARLLSLLLLATPVPALAQSLGVWTDVGPIDASVLPDDHRIEVRRARYVRIDPIALERILDAAPGELASPAGRPDLLLPIPDASGGELRLRVVDSPIMEPELAVRYPDIRTFRVFDADDPAVRGRVDWTPQGFHAMVRTGAGTLFVDPFWRHDRLLYQVYLRSDALPRADREFLCHVTGQSISNAEGTIRARGGELLVGLDLRTYRLALAATGEYTTFHGGTVPAGMAAIVTAMNRVNEVYERDVAIRMILIANNDLVVYTDGTTDPYTNNNGFTMLGQNQTNLDSVIGNANYDIGHVFSTGGGGVASLRVPCVTGSKARGVTGLSNPIGDPFYIDYVAHEMGHQWGGNHTFNGNSGACAGGNRNGSTAYEPGSGATIMAYAGICPGQNLQNLSDDYFHGISLTEITNYSRTGNGNLCAGFIAVGSDPPTVDAGPNYTIPVSTPFFLEGTASSPVGSLTYCWEEFDLGPAGAPGANPATAPLLRSWDPTPEPRRWFPRYQDLIAGTSNIGEFLPSVGRNMNFRLTVRDNGPVAGNFGIDTMSVTVDGASGPFRVTVPDGGETWTGSGPHLVGWNVAGTDSAPVSCPSVDILLSTDGGASFGQTLASQVANDGEVSIPVAAPDSASARVMIRCHGNVFLDLSDANFTIVDANTLIFADGFESGDTSAWSATLP